MYDPVCIRRYELDTVIEGMTMDERSERVVASRDVMINVTAVEGGVMIQE